LTATSRRIENDRAIDLIAGGRMPYVWYKRRVDLISPLTPSECAQRISASTGWFWSCRIRIWSPPHFTSLVLNDSFALRQRRDCLRVDPHSYIWATLKPHPEGTRIEGKLGYHHYQWLVVSMIILNVAVILSGLPRFIGEIGQLSAVDFALIFSVHGFAIAALILAIFAACLPIFVWGVRQILEPKLDPAQSACIRFLEQTIAARRYDPEEVGDAR
jgi:hypothetical protein